LLCDLGDGAAIEDAVAEISLVADLEEENDLNEHDESQNFDNDE